MPDNIPPKPPTRSFDKTWANLFESEYEEPCHRIIEDWIREQSGIKSRMNEDTFEAIFNQVATEHDRKLAYFVKAGRLAPGLARRLMDNAYIAEYSPNGWLVAVKPEIRQEKS